MRLSVFAVKNNTMKKIIIALCALLIGVSTYAQISYKYDEAGNRVAKHVFLDKSAEILADSALATQSTISEESIAIEFQEPALEDIIGEITAKLYPNPTQGAVFIELSTLPQTDMPEFEIWDSTGSLIAKSKITGRVTRVNLWGKPSGMYFVKTILNGQAVTWKIVKK